MSVNETQCSYQNTSGNADSILQGLQRELENTFSNNADASYTVVVDGNVLVIKDQKNQANTLVLSDNLTTASVTVIANFDTEEYGKVTLPHGVVKKFVNNIAGFHAVANLLEPTYGRRQETDVELRQSYIAKSALRSYTMLDSIVSELLNNVANVESASGYENCTNITVARGLPPHSIEIIVEGGDDAEIASAILRRKAGGIQTYGATVVSVPGVFSDPIPIRFNRPQYLYVWLKVTLHGDRSKVPVNYVELTRQSLIKDGASFSAGTDMLYQLLTTGIYDLVAGLSLVEIQSAFTTSINTSPENADYAVQNICVTPRQKVLFSETRIGVNLVYDNAGSA